jgi:hypothetical protein
LADLPKQIIVLIEKVSLMLDLQDNDEGTLEHFGASEVDASLVDRRVRFDENMQLHITCLTDLSPTLDRMVQDSDLAGRKPVTRPNAIASQVTDSARQHVLQVQEKFRNAPTRLVQRLGEANSQRFIRIQNQMQVVQNEPVEAYEQQTVPRSAFAPVSKYRDSDLGSSVATQSHFAPSIASHSSFQSNLANVIKGKLRVPPLPKEVFEGLPFQCFICGKDQFNIKDSASWK